MNRKLNYYITAGSLGLLLSAGITFAWNAVWHGTDWIQTAEPIRSREIAENFEYLKRKVDDLENRINNLNSSTTTLISTEALPIGIIVAGCDYRRYAGSSRYYRSNPYCWGGAVSGNQYGYGKSCPDNAYLFEIWDTVDSSIDGGDGAPYTSYQRNLQGFLCIKR